MKHIRLTRTIAVFAFLAALTLGAFPADAREPGVSKGVSKKELFTAPLAGELGKEVVSDVYSFPPGTVLPWHIHPDAHEVTYVLQGELILEVEGEEPKHLKAGESVYLPPNAVHRGLSGDEEPVKLFVVRIKPADKPLAVDVDPPASP
jgi:quercetin dioxygenase-like cupin family protein